VNVPSAIVKLVPALRAETRGAVKAESAVVLHVTESAGPSEESDSISITLLAVTAVVLITQVAAEALVAQAGDGRDSPLKYTGPRRTC